MIQGVKIFECKRFADNRGFLLEIVKAAQVPEFDWKQTNFTVAHPEVIKAFHWHRKQTDLWFCVSGNIETVLYDRREDSPTHREIQTVAMGEFNPVAILIPSGVVHGYRVLGTISAGLVYLVDQEYDPTKPDEERIPYDDGEIGFNWQTLPR